MLVATLVAVLSADGGADAGVSKYRHGCASLTCEAFADADEQIAADKKRRKEAGEKEAADREARYEEWRKQGEAAAKARAEERAAADLAAKTKAEEEETFERTREAYAQRKAAAKKAKPPKPSKEEDGKAGESVAELSKIYCGEAPARSAWDGLYKGLRDYVKSIANDPGSIDFVGCTDPALNGAPLCWTVTCRYRGKNAFGATVLQQHDFAKNARLWRLVRSK